MEHCFRSLFRALSALLFGVIALGAEPDNFSGRSESEFLFANDAINTIIQKYLQRAVDEHNKRVEKSCDRAVIDDILTETLDRNFPDFYHEFSVNPIPLAGPNDRDDWPMGRKFPSLKKFFTPSVWVKKKDGTRFLIGLDKVDHLFAHGHLNWIAVGKDPSLPLSKMAVATKLGVEQEDGPWGLKSSGIKSYGDLAANYLGTFIWRDLFDSPNPYFKCANGKYSLTRPFDIEPYLEASLDESINCSSYASKELRDAAAEFEKGLGLRCPVDPRACARLSDSYPSGVAEMILHPLCRNVKHEQIEIPNKLTATDIFNIAGALVSGGENLRYVFFPKESGMKAMKVFTGPGQINTKNRGKLMKNPSSQ